MEAGQVPTPRDQPVAPEQITQVNLYVPNETNRLLGYRLWFRVRIEHVPPADAWGAVFPDSKSRGDNAKRQANRFLKWYEEHFPPPFDHAANVLGLSPYKILENIKLMMDTTLWEWDQKKGKKVDTGRPDHKIRVLGHRELIKLVEKSEKWRRQFLEQDQSRPVNLVTVPEFKTMEEFEAWKANRDILKEIEEKRKAAMEAHQRVVEAEGRKLPAPPVNGSHH